MTQRLVKHPYLAIFDGPDTNTSTDARTRSTVPLQALFLMNNPFVQEQAEAWPGRIVRESTDRDGRLERAWELAWGRPPRLGAGAGRPLSRAICSRRGPSGEHLEATEVEAWASLRKVLLTASEFL